MCTYNETLAGCEPVMPLWSKDITILDGFILCGKKEAENNFFELQRPVNGKCSGKKKICGPASQEDFTFCYSASDPCPINYAEIKFEN